MTRAWAWALLAGCAVLVVVPLFPGRIGPLAFAGVAVTFPLALVAFSVAARRHRRPALVAGLAALAGWQLVAAVLVLELSGRPGPGWTGLNPAADWMLLGLGLVPLPVSIALYAATFPGGSES